MFALPTHYLQSEMTTNDTRCFFSTHFLDVSLIVLPVTGQPLLKYRFNVEVLISAFWNLSILINDVQILVSNQILNTFLLLIGHFNVPSINLQYLHVCASHYHQLVKTRRCNSCELCKLVFRKPKAYGKHEHLRAVNKVQAVSIWIRRQLSVYNRWVCGACRQLIARHFIDDETIERARIMFQRLYNENDVIVRTPSSSAASSIGIDDDYHAIVDTCSSSQHQRALAEFQQMLREQGFDGRIQSSSSYSTASLKIPKRLQDADEEDFSSSGEVDGA